MKRFMLSATVAALVSTPVFAQQSTQPMLSQGTRELGLSGIIEIPEFEEIDFDIDLSYGYFVRDGWELGGRALGADVGGVERFDFSVFTEYNFNRGANLVPFLGATVGIAKVDFDDLDITTTLSRSDNESTVLGIQGGFKYFLRPYMAVSTSISFNVSSEDIYRADNELKDNLTRFRLGLRYYF